MSDRHETTRQLNKAADPRGKDNRHESTNKPDNKHSQFSMIKFDIPRLFVWPCGSMAINFEAANRLSVKEGGHVTLYRGEGGIRIGIKPSDENDPAAYLLKENTSEDVLEIECPEFLDRFGGAEQIMNPIGYPLEWDPDLEMLIAVIE